MCWHRAIVYAIYWITWNIPNWLNLGFPKIISLLTNQVVGSDDDATDEQQRTRDSVVAPEDHVVDDSLIDEIADFDEARNSGHHTEDGHTEWCWLISSWRTTTFLCWFTTAVCRKSSWKQK